MAWFNAHVSKTLAWPWMVLGTWQLTPTRLTEHPRRAGGVVGLCGGVTLLIANAYFAFYLAIMAGSLVLATREWRALMPAAAVSICVGLPKLASVLVTGGRETPVVHAIRLESIPAGLFGFWFDDGIRVLEAINPEGYAVVGLPVCALAALTVLWAYVDPGRFDDAWIVGCLTASLVALLIVTASPLVYYWPGLNVFRVPYRAMLILGLVALLLTAALAKEVDRVEFGDRHVELALVAFLVLSVANAAIPPVQQLDGARNGTERLTVGRSVVTSIQEHGCEPVWLETNAVWHDGRGGYHKQIAYVMARRGITATATSYAKIGQEYSTHDNGRLTFDGLVLQNNATLPENRVTLTGGWWRPDRGRIDGRRFGVVDRISTPGDDVRIYAVDGDCRTVDP
jgi:hypothetical protein